MEEIGRDVAETVATHKRPTFKKYNLLLHASSDLYYGLSVKEYNHALLMWG